MFSVTSIWVQLLPSASLMVNWGTSILCLDNCALICVRIQSQMRGHSVAVTHFLFVTGRDLAGNLLSMEDYLERGAAIHDMRSCWLDMHVSSFMVELGFKINYWFSEILNWGWMSWVEFPFYIWHKFLGRWRISKHYSIIFRIDVDTLSHALVVHGADVDTRIHWGFITNFSYTSGIAFL